MSYDAAISRYDAVTMRYDILRELRCTIQWFSWRLTLVDTRRVTIPHLTVTMSYIWVTMYRVSYDASRRLQFLRQKMEQKQWKIPKILSHKLPQRCFGIFYLPFWIRIFLEIPRKDPNSGLTSCWFYCTNLDLLQKTRKEKVKTTYWQFGSSPQWSFQRWSSLYSPFSLRKFFWPSQRYPEISNLATFSPYRGSVQDEMSHLTNSSSQMWQFWGQMIFCPKIKGKSKKTKEKQNAVASILTLCLVVFRSTMWGLSKLMTPMSKVSKPLCCDPIRTACG